MPENINNDEVIIIDNNIVLNDTPNDESIVIEKFYLYKIINKINDKFYIGVTKHLKTRFSTHLCIARGGKEKFPHHYQYIHAAINRHGSENFEMILLQTFNDEDLAYIEETNMITKFRSEGVKIYNIAGGGKGTGSGPNHPMYGKKLPEEWKAKVIEATKNKSEETIEKHRSNMLERNWVGENHPMFGKKHSNETKEKISKAGKGRIVLEETRKKISQANKGKPTSEEAKIKRDKTMKNKDCSGSNNPNYGNRWSEEQRKNLSDKKKGKPNLILRKLSNEQVVDIFKLRKTGLSFFKIAIVYNTSKSVIINIIKRKTYSDVII